MARHSTHDFSLLQQDLDGVTVLPPEMNPTDPLPAIQSLTRSVASGPVGTAVTWTVTLADVAPVGGAVASLTATGVAFDPALPQNVSITAGNTSGQVVLDAAGAAGSGTVTATAVSGCTGSANAGFEVTPTPSILSINADGFSAEWDGTPPTAVLNEPITVQREGFSATGTPTTIEDVVPVIHRVRQPVNSPSPGDNSSYDGPFVYFPERVAMADWICAGDTIAGVTNNSALVSPKPVCKWVGVDRLTIGNTLAAGTLGVVASHWAARLGQEVRCVEWIVSDGTTTLDSVFTSAPSLTNFAGMVRQVPAMMNPAIDITSLAEGEIFVRAKVSPWFGSSASVADSNDSTDDWAFSTQIFHKNVAKAAAPPLAVVKPSTGTSGGVISTDYATALATPFDTPGNVVLALVGATYASITGQVVDGARILLNEDLNIANPFTNVAARAQVVGALTIARDPNVARGSARLLQWAGRPRLGSGGTLATGVRTGRIHFEDLDIVRAASGGQILGEAAENASFAVINCAWDNNNLAATPFGSNTAAGVGKWQGVAFTNAAVGVFWQGQGGVHWFVGVSGTVGTASVSTWHMIGCNLNSMTNGAVNSPQGYDGSMVAFNVLDGITGVAAIISGGNLNITTGMGILSNVFVRIDGNNPNLLISGDTPNTTSTIGITIHHNTNIGYGLYGRWNVGYDETVATGRTHQFFSVKGNIAAANATKFDISSGVPARQGSLALSHAVGRVDNLFTDLTGSPPVYVGPNSQLPPTQDDADRLQPTYVDYRGITVGPVAGTVGGDYRIEEGSIGADASTWIGLSHDLLETPRTVGDCLGAYSEAVPV